MVFEDESSDDLSGLQISSSSDGMHYQIPASIEDQDYNGLENAPEGLCVEHRLPTERRVAFESFETGRRFLVCAQHEDRVLDFSSLQAKEKRDERASASVVAAMKNEMEKKEAENFKMKEKYKVLMNLIEAQGTVIRNMKMNHLKEKEKLTEGNNNLKIQVDELTKSLKKVTEENVQLNLHMSDLKRGHENLIKRRDEVKLQLAVQLKSLEKSKEKLKLIHDILKE
ncbi:hypothetical protein VPH35_063235 [Triticum aestivum]